MASCLQLAIPWTAVTWNIEVKKEKNKEKKKRKEKQQQLQIEELVLSCGAVCLALDRGLATILNLFFLTLNL